MHFVGTSDNDNDDNDHCHDGHDYVVLCMGDGHESNTGGWTKF